MNADADTVAACPECDAASVSINAPGGYADVPTGKRYRCATCSARFDEYVERERKGVGGGTVSGLAKRLSDADPDEVGP